MSDREATQIQVKYNLMPIDSECKGLKYIVDEQRQGIAIAGYLGMVGLTKEQAETLARELPDIIREWL